MKMNALIVERTVWVVEEMIDKNTPKLISIYATKPDMLSNVKSGDYCHLLWTNDGILHFSKGTVDSHYGVFRAREVEVKQRYTDRK